MICIDLIEARLTESKHSSRASMQCIHRDACEMRAGCHVVQAELWHATVIGLDVLLHAGREEFMRGVHDGHAQCSTHGYIYMVCGGGAGAQGGAQRQSRGDTTHLFPHCTSSLAAMVRDGHVGVHGGM